MTHKHLFLWLIFGFILMLPVSLFAQHEGTIQVMTPEVKAILRSSPRDQEIAVIISFAKSSSVEDRSSNDAEVTQSRAQMITTWHAQAETTQRGAREHLRARGVKDMTVLWAINGLAVSAKPEVIEELAELGEVLDIRLDSVIEEPEVIRVSAVSPEWNLEMMHVPTVWAKNHTGTGVVVATMDSGVDLAHPDLVTRWRGGKNSWFDPNLQHSTPFDKSGHGTQTMGLLVGGDASGGAIGVAPGALWIAVKIFNDSNQTSLSAIHKGFQWLIDPDGDPKTDDAPRVVSNSWVFNQLVDHCNYEFVEDIEALRTAGIAITFAAGNEGPGAFTSVSPANYLDVFSVGFVDQAAVLSNQSSRGPSRCGPKYYPTVVAPAVNVKTADLTFGGVVPASYAVLSGSSLAAPQAAGVMALLFSAYPEATVTQVEQAIRMGARDLTGMGPNNDYGFGLIDADQALQALSRLIYRPARRHFGRSGVSGVGGVETGPDNSVEIGESDRQESQPQSRQRQ